MTYGLYKIEIKENISLFFHIPPIILNIQSKLSTACRIAYRLFLFVSVRL